MRVQDPDRSAKVVTHEFDWLLEVSVIRDDYRDAIPRTEAVNQEMGRQIDV
jgi:hypothetical protein